MTDRELMQVALDVLELVDGYVMGKHEAVEALRARLKQPVPEPFGWYNAEHDEIITNSWYLEQRKNNPSDDSGFSIPLYTAPPKKEWVGLTNDAIEYIVDAYWDDPPMFIEAIESKLKKENDF